METIWLHMQMIYLQCNVWCLPKKATAKDLGDVLETRNLLEDDTGKKFLATKIFNYKKIDSIHVGKKFNEIIHILNQLTQHNKKIDDSISISSIIVKLLLS